MTAPTPNAALAYKILDHIDAHPEEWNQGVYIGERECGTVACFAGRACLLSGDRARVGDGWDTIWLADGETRIPDRAEELLGVSRWVDRGSGVEVDLFGEQNTRTDLGELVAEIFGPRPDAADALVDAILRDGPAS